MSETFRVVLLIVVLATLLSGCDEIAKQITTKTESAYAGVIAQDGSLWVVNTVTGAVAHCQTDTAAAVICSPWSQAESDTATPSYEWDSASGKLIPLNEAARRERQKKDGDPLGLFDQEESGTTEKEETKIYRLLEEGEECPGLLVTEDRSLELGECKTETNTKVRVR